jgi:hypothetical protein
MQVADYYARQVPYAIRVRADIQQKLCRNRQSLLDLLSLSTFFIIIINKDGNSNDPHAGRVLL